MVTKRTDVRHGFTLVELLVVIAIIGLLVALLLPAVNAAREAARRVTCVNKFKQAGLALLNYESALQTFPPGMKHWDARFGNPTNGSCAPAPDPAIRGFSWSTYILPYLEEQARYELLDFEKVGGYADRADNGNGTSNFAVSGEILEFYVCPSDDQGTEQVRCCSAAQNGTHPDEDMGRTNMAGVADSLEWQCSAAGGKHFHASNGFFGNVEGAETRRIVDGLSKTIVLAEVLGAGQDSHLGHFWSNWNIIDTRDGINGPFTITGGQWDDTGKHGMRNTGAASRHPGGANFAMGDGHVEFLAETISPEVFEQMTTRDSQELDPPPGPPRR